MNNLLNKYLWKCRIDVTEFTDNEPHFITLREPTTHEMKQLAKIEKLFIKVTDEDVDSVFDGVHQFAELCNTLIIDHDFISEGEDGKKLPAKEVAEFIDCKMDLNKAIMREYMSTLPLRNKSGKK